MDRSNSIISGVVHHGESGAHRLQNLTCVTLLMAQSQMENDVCAFHDSGGKSENCCQDSESEIT